MDPGPQTSLQSSSFFREFNSAAGWAGLTAFIFLVFGALTIQLSVLSQLQISTAQQSSWITITWLTTAVVAVPMSLYYRQPLAIARTIPGLVYMGSLAGEFTLQEFAAANLVTAIAVLVVGITGLSSRVISLVPMPILMGMFAASILEYETRLVESVVDDVEIAGLMVAAFVLGRLLNLRQLPPVGLAVIAGAVAIGVFGRAGDLTIDSTLPTLTVPGFDFSLEAILTVTVPMTVLVLGVGNVQSMGFMIAEGYRPPANLTTVLMGGMSAVNSVFGGHPAAMARTVTAIVAGREAGRLETRYWACVVAFTGALGVALGTGVIVAVIRILPPAYVFTMAGLAILASFQDAMTRAFAGSLRLGSVVAFVVTLGTFTVAGIPPAFWALIAGIVASLLLEQAELHGYWRTAFKEEGSPAS